MDRFLFDTFSLLLWLYLIGVFFYFVEKIRPIDKKQGFVTKDFKLELIYSVINGTVVLQIFNSLLVILLISEFFDAYIPAKIFDSQIQSLPFVFQVLIALFILDFIVYIRHYFTHVFMWPVHSIHHSAENISWITGYRLHPFEVLLSLFCKYSFLYVLGFEGEGIFYAGLIMAFMNLFTHANLDWEFPAPLKYIISSPNYHRWHHAIEKEAINKNFVVVFPFIDLIFGTYYFPEKKLPKKYGIYGGPNKVPDGYLKQLSYPIKQLKK